MKEIKPFEIRRWVHHTNGTAAVVLLITGTLITIPDLRTALVGGYGKIMSDIHSWTGLAFVCVPLFVLIFARDSLLTNLKKRIFDAKKIHWRRVHLSISLFSGTMLAVSGSLIWFDTVWELPIPLMDVLFLAHTTFAWAIGLALPVHLWVARRSIMRNTQKFFEKKHASPLIGSKSISPQ